MRTVVLFFLLAAGAASAVPNPSNTFVVFDENDLESAALAAEYARARDLPDAHQCGVDLGGPSSPAPPTEGRFDLAFLEERLLPQVRACLSPRAEALVLARGMPVNVDVEGSAVSLAAALSAMNLGLIGEAPGAPADCGQPCETFAFANPWQSGAKPAELLLVTALTGYSDAAARGLIQNALAAEAAPAGDFVLMRAPVGNPRAALDFELDEVQAELFFRDLSAEVVDFDTDLAGRSLAGFVVGTQSLGDTIEGNTFLPGAIVDNLTSFGAVPANFDPEAEEVQVSIARWVDAGVTGVHGTTAEPLSNAFPSRRFLVEYADGATLAEAFFRHLPAVYWRNLVVGDPMAAPYAARPAVTITSTAPLRIEVDTGRRGLASLELFIDGVPTELTECTPLPAGEHQLLAVAVDDRAPWPAAGWTALRVEVPEAGLGCGDEPPRPEEVEASCAQGAGAPVWLLLLLALQRRRAPK